MYSCTDVLMSTEYSWLVLSTCSQLLSGVVHLLICKTVSYLQGLTVQLRDDQ